MSQRLRVPRPNKVFVAEDVGFSLSDRLCVAVGNSLDQIISDEYVFWGSKNGNDFYMTSASLRRDLKLSVHPGRNEQVPVATFGFTAQAHKNSVHALAYEHRNWFRIKILPVQTQILCEIRIVCDEHSPGRQLHGRNLSYIPPPPAGHVVQLQLVLHRGTGVVPWRKGGRLLGHISNANNEHLVIIAEAAGDPAGAIVDWARRELDGQRFMWPESAEAFTTADAVTLFGYTPSRLFQITEIGGGAYARLIAEARHNIAI